MLIQTPDLVALAASHGTEVLERYRRLCQAHMSAAIWATVCLRFQYGLSIPEIARAMNKAPSTIWGRLTRAKQLLEQREAALRREAYEIGRKALEE